MQKLVVGFCKSVGTIILLMRIKFIDWMTFNGVQELPCGLWAMVQESGQKDGGKTCHHNFDCSRNDPPVFILRQHGHEVEHLMLLVLVFAYESKWLQERA